MKGSWMMVNTLLSEPLKAMCKSIFTGRAWPTWVTHEFWKLHQRIVWGWRHWRVQLRHDASIDVKIFAKSSYLKWCLVLGTPCILVGVLIIGRGCKPAIKKPHRTKAYCLPLNSEEIVFNNGKPYRVGVVLILGWNISAHSEWRSSYELGWYLLDILEYFLLPTFDFMGMSL